MEPQELVERIMNQLESVRKVVSVVHITPQTGDLLYRAARREGPVFLNTKYIGLCGGVRLFISGVPFIQHKDAEDLSYYNSLLEKKGILDVR